MTDDTRVVELMGGPHDGKLYQVQRGTRHLEFMHRDSSGMVYPLRYEIHPERPEARLVEER